MTKIKILGISLVLGLVFGGLFILPQAKAQSICTSACASPTPSFTPIPTPTGTVTTTPTPTPPSPSPSPTPPSATPTPPLATPESTSQTATSATGSVPLFIEGRACSLSTALALPIGSVLGYASLLGFSILGLISLKLRR